MELKPLHLLLVEDDEVDILNVRRAFERARLVNPLWIARDGEEALALLRSGEIPKARRLVLLDLNMPRMGGIEFLRVVRADPELSTLPVVVLTTSNDDRDRVEAYRLHVAGYLLKPVRFGDFVDLMATLHRYWAVVELPDG